ncbi:hypothetical protein [Sphingosinicella sp. BN140058]|uniref:hypothetical protein n=1 Tax=Sphingosinicella sp. BN140058 TaxID=1892855 RepID=UPI00101063C7|nr:hypothetical protein [Sphingosinicella sp. BN140058]QAY78128.1 hypothetical protein ETR14_17550 [Sphingosinicella sp. BN140058]
MSAEASLEHSTRQKWRPEPGFVNSRFLRVSDVYTLKLVFHAQEMSDGQWLWHGERVSYDVLLREVAAVRSLNPHPSILFNFAVGHGCGELDRMRREIAVATKCSADGIRCLQGTLAEFNAHT